MYRGGQEDCQQLSTHRRISLGLQVPRETRRSTRRPLPRRSRAGAPHPGNRRSPGSPSPRRAGRETAPAETRPATREQPTQQADMDLPQSIELLGLQVHPQRRTPARARGGPCARFCRQRDWTRNRTRCRRPAGRSGPRACAESSRCAFVGQSPGERRACAISESNVTPIRPAAA